MTQVYAFLLAISPEPLFPDWNLRLLRALFHLLPHTSFRDTAAQFLVENPLVSTFILAAASYAYWRIEDNRTGWRRRRLIVLALVLSTVALVTLAVRPWLGWPAPVLSPRFKALYPEDL